MYDSNMYKQFNAIKDIYKQFNVIKDIYKVYETRNRYLEIKIKQLDTKKIYIKSNKMRGDKKRGGVGMSAETKTLLSGDRVHLSHNLLEYDKLV